MDMKMKYKSLPPLVEGKIHGYLRLVIDELIWLKQYLGEISVFVSWWGETDKAQFRPADITRDIIRSQQETTTVYAIRTNLNLFEEYIKNCESIELVVVSEETDAVIGKSQITDLLEIFKSGSCFRYVSIVNNSGNKIGKLHISMKLKHVTKSSSTLLKTSEHDKQVTAKLPFVSDIKNQTDVTHDRYTTCRKLKSEDNEIYKSVLKSRRTEFQEPVKRFNNEVTDNQVAQVVARAQRLRGALLKETCNEDVLTFNDNSLSNSLQSHISSEEQAKLCEYILGEDMTSSNENEALCTFRSTSLNPNLIDDTFSNLKTCKYDNKISTSNTQANSSIDEILEKKQCTSTKEIAIFKHVDYIRIFVKSFTLSPAGYRRVKSCSLSHNDNNFLSATYFVQYNMSFEYIRKIGKKWIKENRPIRICSKKQTKQVIYLNHDGIYGISKSKPSTEYVIRFKLFVRHLSKKSLIELGTASIHLSDIMKNQNWSVAQPLIILNKGIKVGELSILVELGSDSSHFGQHTDDIISTKTDIPILQTQELLTEDSNKGGKNVTENQTKPNSQRSSTSVRKIDHLSNVNDLPATKSLPQYKVGNVDDRTVDVKNQENVEDKVLLHGLIYVAEGKQLPELNTYLICRAFWREDKIRSQVCNNTTTPFYHFCQLVPLIYGNDLLNRIRDNYIIIEVYYRNNNVDNLLGLAKLPVHQLYVAYRDPRVLPHLLLSKYPIVGVDGWVPIVDPVTSQSYGQLLALVALGTPEQIALLEMSKGLRNIAAIPQTVSESSFGCMKRLQAPQQLTHSPKQMISNVETFLQNSSQTNIVDNTTGTWYPPNLKTQECQTDISTVKEFKCNKRSQKEVSNPDYSVSHNAIDRSTQAFNVNKAIVDQAAQTEADLEEKQQIDAEEQMCMNELYFNNGSDDSDNNSIRHNFHLPTNTYRSVGVGAEYNEENDQQLNAVHSNATFNMPSVIHTENESRDFTCDQTSFRAIVEIECALHLPKVEKAIETVEPSTYVSFQANKSDPLKQSNSYMITNVFPHSCNPKWNWKCDTKLSTELLFHDEKRLILKIWRLFDPDISTQISLEKDIVIGFSAIDLSILISGFPTVSGWFHIMDFTGRCNGQIKVCITPLDNLTLLGKPTTLSTTRLPVSTVSQLSEFSPCNYEMHYDAEGNDTNYSASIPAEEEDKSVHSENQLKNCVTHVGLEDMSMSFLSLSLKQKLTELDEITKRLESRLRDVTNTAFVDDFENEFDLNEPNSDNENNDYKPTNSIASTVTTNNNGMTHQMSHNKHTTETVNQIVSNEKDTLNHLPESYTNYNRAISHETMKPSSSKVSSFCRKRNLSNNNYCVRHQNDNLIQNIKTSDILTDCPERGTKTHINYLLDKLSLQFPVQSHSTKKSSSSPLINTQQSNKNISFQDNGKCDQEPKMYTVPTQTDNVDERDAKRSESQMENYVTIDEDVECNNRDSPDVTQSQITNKMSTVIREELLTEENSNTSRCDELTTYLVTSNIRHMDLNNIFNPLLYPHLVPDLHHLNPSSEEEIIEQLDKRYSKAFNASINSGLNKAQSLIGINTSPENTDLFRKTPSGVSENVIDSIDLTVLHKSSNNDLLASNSTDSTTTITTEKLIDTETTENSYSTSSETSVLSRQAPDGGNPVEDITKPVIVQQNSKTHDSSSSSYN